MSFDERPDVLPVGSLADPALVRALRPSGRLTLGKAEGVTTILLLILPRGGLETGEAVLQETGGTLSVIPGHSIGSGHALADVDVPVSRLGTGCRHSRR